MIDEGGTVILSGAFSDPGQSEPFAVSVDWGDGNTEDVALGPEDRSFILTHRYLDDDPTGTSWDLYTIAVNVTDEGGAAASDQATVRVNNLSPEISSLVSSAPEVGDAEPGDTVSVSGCQGKVTETNLRYTVLEGENARFLVPNSLIFTKPLKVIFSAGGKELDRQHRRQQ